MGNHTAGPYRATATVSAGANWTDIPKIYDGDANSYSYRKSYSTSATHINGFGINNLPTNAVVDSVEIHSKLYASNSYGYLMVYMYTDEGSTSIASKKVVDGASFNAAYVTHTYTAAEIKSVLDSKGVCNGDILQFLKTLRVRFVIGNNKTSILQTTECRVYDNYVVVNYTIPDFTLTVNATVGGTVTGGGSYESGKTVNLTATPNDGYKFVSWSDGNTSASRTVTVTGNVTYTAVFEKIETSKVYNGSQKVSVYCGTKKLATYCGTQKLT